jgi:hypothetical protein
MIIDVSEKVTSSQTSVSNLPECIVQHPKDSHLLRLYKVLKISSLFFNECVVFVFYISSIYLSPIFYLKFCTCYLVQFLICCISYFNATLLI